MCGAYNTHFIEKQSGAESTWDNNRWYAPGMAKDGKNHQGNPILTP
jgi:hypothetical protein